MPSLWYEGFGLIAMEAMLRGLPVISSDLGGLVEARQGSGFVIPVRPIERYEPVFDENHMPKPVDVRQDIRPWKRAVETLLGDRDVYEGGESSRQAALRFVSGLQASQFEEMLHFVSRSGAGRAEPRPSGRPLAARRLLLQRLRERSSK
jgi:glycosyltransferase involved in cell wall biosynthesis